ncbi:S41 family peptidase [Fulvivirga lutea]|uniref:Tail specific protease domain-containing protein n=1 Tax=Fulvivirga lutea TaxID=2810512 RepID=A0A974WIA8_9BACT|nr:S41 family peptidase [Fulvivirga lutea]QSE98670.1 hypothetical protein JR347_06210 [Fulvivirga lutea]
MMNKPLFFLLISYFLIGCHGSSELISTDKIKDDFDQLLENLEEHYIYFEEKNIDIECIKCYYDSLIPRINNRNQALLFFESVLNEFHDNHLILSANVSSSYRLYAPIYLTYRNDEFYISNVWSSNIIDPPVSLVGSKLLQFNSNDFKTLIQEFPVFCADKNNQKVKTWIANKIIAGRYDRPRLMTVEQATGDVRTIDLDQIETKQVEDLLTYTIRQNIGIICINNSLGNNDLIGVFDEVLDNLMETKSIIIDLRNTINGGNTYVARALMGHFVDTVQAYQMHSTSEKVGNNPEVARTWVEYVSPRKPFYNKPVFIIVGRWTGSMGEGIAVAFDSFENATVIGSEMAGLGGEVTNFSFRNRHYSYQLPTTKLYHIDGTLREEFSPRNDNENDSKDLIKRMLNEPELFIKTKK